MDVNALRAQFPALARTEDDKPVVYLDNPGGTQVPQPVVDAMTGCLVHHSANHGGAFGTSARSKGRLPVTCPMLVP